MAVEEAGQEDGDGLAQRHNDGKNCRAELIDGVKYKKLTTGRAHGEHDGVEGEF